MVVGTISASIVDEAGWVMGIQEVNKDRNAVHVGIVVGDDGDDYEWQWASIDSGSDVHTCPMYMETYGSCTSGSEAERCNVQGGRMRSIGL
eukprot:2906332-Heterocapsa_arctica.AAC.1